MSDLESAARRLRDSVAALPNWARRWQARGGIIESAGAWPIAEVRDLSRSDRAETTDAVAAHIATTASPPTVTLWAGHLEAMEALRDEWDEEGPGQPRRIDAATVERALATARALASAILHTDQHDSEGR